MRWARPLLLIAILALLAGVGRTFYSRLNEQFAHAAKKPAPLPAGTASAAQDWTYTQTVNSKPVVFVRAKDYQEVEGKYLLNGLELHIFHKDAKEYDQVKSAKAEFDMNQGMLFSEGDVEIVMGVKADAKPSGRLMTIKTSGVHLETKTGKATTDRPASFGFDQGEGKAVGASYDPQAHELHMNSQVELNWRGRDPKTKPMKVESGELNYKEAEGKVYLAPWSKLTRDTLALTAGPAIVTLGNGLIQKAEAQNAQGTDQRPHRNLTYAADQLGIDFDENGQIKKIVGERNAKLVSTADTAQTTVTSDRVDLDFNTADKDSVLQNALATGHGVLESKPIPQAGVQLADTRILRSEVIATTMRPGGQEVEHIETRSPGTLEFLPNRPNQPHRWMNGENMWIVYGPKNQIESFKSTQVSTRTEKPKAPNAKEPPPPSLTWSKDIKAEFDPKTAQLARLEQWNDFRYEEGVRKAKANRAVLEQARNSIDLSGAARVWDPTGSTDADKIVLDQKTGDFLADGHVNSTRMPDKNKEDATSGGMLAEDEPLHAKANKMSSTENNLLVRYEGNVVTWQGTNRLQGDVIEIDRDNDVLKAHGHVISQLLDKDEEGSKTPEKDPGAPAPKSTAKQAKPSAPPVFTIVKAPELVYNDEERLAHYTGGVFLDRGAMKMRSKELRAFLRDDSEDSSLDHAFADGNVEIVQTAPSRRTRTGTSEHAEYYVDEDKLILEGGQPQLVDSRKGTTRGSKLTWFSQDDRLLVVGAEGKPANSKIQRK
ncbi:MAG: LPS export ABC transporter periplasmic protein LptC [Acidobacteriota bacterium]|nr:LPS export ABC transporter periplasmic protein LptC [Acidobacteriota bacterium]